MIHSGSSMPPSEHAEGMGLDVRHYAVVLLRRWPLVLGSVALCVGAAWWAQKDTLPTFTAEALLQHRIEAPVLGVPSLFSGGPDLGSQAEILRSRAVLAPVVDSLGLQLSLATHQGLRTRLFPTVQVNVDAQPARYILEPARTLAELRGGFPGEVIAQVGPDGFLEGPDFRVQVDNLSILEEPIEFSVLPRDLALMSLQARLEVQPGGGLDLMRVGYSSPDPMLAAAVVNAVSNTYQRHRMVEARQAAGRRREVVSLEMQSLADSVRRAQSLLNTYQENTQLLNPDVEGNALMTALLDTENELRTLRFERSLLEGLVAGLQTGDAGDEGLSRVMALGRELVPSGPELDQRLQDLLAERRALTVNRFGATASAPEVEVLDAQLASTRQQMRITAEQSLALMQSRIDASSERVSDIRTQMGGLPARTSEYTRLQQQVDGVQAVFDRLVGNYYEAQIAEGVEAGDVIVVDPAPVPMFPDPSGMVLNLLVALIGGLILGVAGALFLDHLDTRVRLAGDARRASGIEILGTVPRIQLGSKRSQSAELGMEAFRGIVTNLRYVTSEGPQILGICSSAPREGKSTVTANLALSMVEHGHRVLVVDADLRRARMHELLDVDPSPGLLEVLTLDASLADTIQLSPLHPSLHVLPSGNSQRNLVSLTQHKALRRLLESLRGQYDRILVDMPPILAVNDSSVVAGQMDGNIIVVRADSTDREALADAVAQLRRVHANVLGIVLNDTRLRSVAYYSYYRTYSSETENTSRRGTRERRTKALTSGPS